MNGPPVPESVTNLAVEHLKGIRPPQGCRWQPPVGQRVTGGWFFTYLAERVPPDRRPPPSFGYFPGYLVADDGTVEEVDEAGLSRLVEGIPLT